MISNIMVDALLASRHNGWKLQLSLYFLHFCTVSPLWPHLFYPSSPAAFCPLNQSRVRFREEVNTLVLWLGPFLRRGLYNWKALSDYFRTLVGTDSHVCAYGWERGSLFFLSRWLLHGYGVFGLFCSMIIVLYRTKSSSSVKQISAASPRRRSVCQPRDKIRTENVIIKEKKRSCIVTTGCVFRTGFYSDHLFFTPLYNPRPPTSHKPKLTLFHCE